MELLLAVGCWDRNDSTSFSIAICRKLQAASPSDRVIRAGYKSILSYI